MEMKKNKRNAASQHHGYWETYHDNDKKYVKYKCHYFNGNEIGYEEYFNSNGFIIFQCHYINGYKIGCRSHIRSQHFYKTPDKKFGEQIKWK